MLLAERSVMARLRDRRFTSLGAANEAIAELVAWVNAQPYKKLPGSVSPCSPRSTAPP